MSFTLISPAFKYGERIPRKYTCDGEDVSPPLQWSGTPQGTKSLVLIMEDPDAPIGLFTHWVLYNIPPTRNELPENVAKNPTVEGIGLQGINDFGRVGYGGPCPPRGHGPHRYFFRLYALDITLNLRPRASRNDVLNAIKNHVIGTAEYMGTYSR
ncbi:YbhB/YbcL family Raf kinase inhibitor-like protein [Vulcanisaeta thermophila]|uniref:YbhB/YbcL family Raf kinase inhibitor-like protein n=1 Tax=Vulcanisaeta thermophila TaxID=867917 RepID=UPI0008535BFC|nr:YbhB/YbcL family Raf kinase inhibitor-like protein [Vulcanisaeta thermophila]